MTDLLMYGHGAVDGTVTLTLRGEVDLANRDELAAKLDGCIASTTGGLRIDCADLEFIDSSGLGVLIKAHKDLERENRRLTFTNVGPLMFRVLDLTGLVKMFHVEEPAA